MRTLVIVWLVMYCAHGVYVTSGWWLHIHKALNRPPERWVNEVWKWTKWPAFGNILLLGYFSITGQFGARFTWETVALAVIWWFFRNAGDDDFKKKLKKKLTEAVAQVGDKLVIVPKAA